ncbi:hypothetical protein AB0300_14195 [Microbacterium sp. NPDC078814]|uniref:hypothetical protein n=1 Tax=Microbacterium sp. NPDC078814 TaxID=3154767 RepID=UPI00344E68F9
MHNETSFDAGSLFEIDDEPWELVSVRNGRDAKLRRAAADDDWIVMSIAELHRLATPRVSLSRSAARPVQDDWPTDVLDMELHLLEIFRGQPMSSTATAPRPAFDITRTTQEQRLAAKTAELEGTSLARTRRTLFNYWTVYQSEGVAGLNARMHRKGQRKVSRRVRQIPSGGLYEGLL